jgi:transmembrane sensor
MPEKFYESMIVKELKGESTNEESQKITQWVTKDAANLKIYNELWSAYALASPNVSAFQTDKEVAWSKISKKIITSRRSSNFVIQFSRIAAAAVLFFLAGIAVQFFTSSKISPGFLNQYSTVIVPEGQKSMVVLPDGSKVWLNSGTTLKYKSDFNTTVREVEIDGEAYFDVKKDKTRMFKVNTGEVNVEVYGTAFNVKNYKEEKKLEVTVENGNVGVIRAGSKLADLIKGKQATIHSDNKEVVVSSASVDVVTAWKNNQLIFDGTPFEDGIRYLERWYGVKIQIEEKIKKQHNYTFKVKTESLRELLKLLQVITPLTYKIDGKNVTIKYAD